MPLTPAEKMRRYRERLKENPEKMEEQRKKNLERIKSKYVYKKVKDMTEKEKKVQRKKWRDQKRKTKQKTKKDTDTTMENENLEISLIPDKLQVIKRLKKSRNMYKNQWNNAQSRIEYLNRLTENLRKKIYRLNQKHMKTEEDLKKQITMLTARNEILELSLKNAYKRCHSNKEKDVFKSIANNDTVKVKRASSFIQKTLGLKGKIRKRKKAAKILRSKNAIDKLMS